MKQVKWFERRFDFSFQQNIFPSIVERLEATPILLRNKVSNISKEHLISKANGKWSIQENIGHIIDLEPIWQGRLKDILSGKAEMRSIDLENKKTNLALHNNKNMNSLLEELFNIRALTIKKLKNLSEKDIYKQALHPRLKTPMRIMDLFLFVAEHDAHHLSRIAELKSYIK
ncbi:MAG: DinB family protein [Bacteroidetes bacterium]|nr:MAG: DinB family protein [Bacteroidota bacterium]